MIRNETFTLEGNQESKAGNPLPYLRRTQGSLWTKQSLRYDAWVQFVRRECYFQTTLKEKFYTVSRGKRLEVLYKHPFELEPMQQAHMSLLIHFAGENHADPDNIFKGIADALFLNDKHLTGTFDFVHSPKKRGLVEVNITISEAEARSTLAVAVKGKKRPSRALK